MSRLFCKLNVTNLDLDAERKDFMCSPVIIFGLDVSRGFMVTFHTDLP